LYNSDRKEDARLSQSDSSKPENELTQFESARRYETEAQSCPDRGHLRLSRDERLCFHFHLYIALAFYFLIRPLA